MSIPREQVRPRTMRLVEAMHDVLHLDKAWEIAQRFLDEEREEIVRPVRELYYAAHWTPDRECNAEALWTAVRDAAGLPPGLSPKRDRRTIEQMFADVLTQPLRGRWDFAGEGVVDTAR